MDGLNAPAFEPLITAVHLEVATGSLPAHGRMDSWS